MELNVTTLEGKDAGKVSLSDAIFGLDPREDILARMIRYQLANKAMEDLLGKPLAKPGRVKPGRGVVRGAIE